MSKSDLDNKLRENGQEELAEELESIRVLSSFATSRAGKAVLAELRNDVAICLVSLVNADLTDHNALVARLVEFKTKMKILSTVSDAPTDEERLMDTAFEILSK